MLDLQNGEQQRIGELIRQYRKNKKITQTELGKLLGIGKKAISTYEHGIIKIIPYEKRIKIAEILNIPISSLLYSSECRMSNVKENSIFDFMCLSGVSSEYESEWTQEDDLFYNAPTQENLFCKKFIAGTEKMTFCNAAYTVFAKAKAENVENVQRIFEILLRLHKVPFRDAQGLAFVFARLYEMYKNAPNGENLDFVQELKLDRGI